MPRLAVHWAEVAGWGIASFAFLKAVAFDWSELDAGPAAASLLVVSAALIGLVIAPRAVWRAFRRGRATRNLYEREWDDGILDRTVGDLRRELGLDAQR